MGPKKTETFSNLFLFSVFLRLWGFRETTGIDAETPTGTTLSSNRKRVRAALLHILLL
jgi:hypothetical protein